jgi:Phage integrase family
MRVGDVREIADVDSRLLRTGAPELVVTVRDPKTGLHNAEQSVFVLNRAVTGLLREWVAVRRTAGARDDDSLFGRTRGQLHYALERVVKPLGAAVHFTWHSLRHGAATLLFMAGWSTAEVMHHGRWTCEISAWRYQQSGRASAAAHGVAPALIREGERVSAALGSSLSRPTALQEM